MYSKRHNDKQQMIGTVGYMLQSLSFDKIAPIFSLLRV